MMALKSQGLLELVLPFIHQLSLNQKISKRWSDEGSATTGSSRRVEKNIGVLLLMDAVELESSLHPVVPFKEEEDLDKTSLISSCRAEKRSTSYNVDASHIGSIR